MMTDGFHAPRPNLDALQRHVEQLCRDNAIWWKPWLKRSTKA
jgi:hypothetical protein